MRHGNLTREQAVALVGEDAVSKVEKINCEPTSRLQCDGDTDVEFAASVRAVSNETGVDVHVTAYYYQAAEAVTDCDDLSNLDWEIEGFEVA